MSEIIIPWYAAIIGLIFAIFLILLFVKLSETKLSIYVTQKNF
ncbi:hypothetical protein [Enterococcus faecium]